MENGLKLINRFLFLFLFSGICFADITVKGDFNYLNQLRLSTQLHPFIWNTALANAAQNHAAYLSFNKQYGHHEKSGRNHFTGEWASERALFSQYPNRLVAENISSKIGEKLYFNPIDSLMSAIYHRFGFLDLNNNEIGIGQQLGELNSHVYVMGNSALSAVCQQPDFNEAGTYHFNICAESKKRVNKPLVDKAKQTHQIKNPKIILWPPNKAHNIAPAFFQESPDPLPHHAISGYPISIQFNPSFYKKPPKLVTFKVQISNQATPITAITVMNKANDPNHKFSDYQHAFFPEKRLSWDTTYTVTVKYINQDTLQHQHINWSFHTKSFKTPIIKITQSHQKIKVQVGQDIILYFPPINAQDTQTAVRTKDYHMKLKLNYLDKNTLKVTINQAGKAEINFHHKIVELFTE